VLLWVVGDRREKKMACLGIFVMILLVSLAFSSTTSASTQTGEQPEQIHMAFTGVSSERIVNYVTQYTDAIPKTVAQYGKSAKQLDNKSVGKSEVYHLPEHENSKKPRNLTIHNVKVSRPHASRVEHIHTKFDHANNIDFD
jgi:hypothetical protein